MDNNEDMMLEEEAIEKQSAFFNYVRDISSNSLLTEDETKKYGEDLLKINDISIAKQKKVDMCNIYYLNLPLVLACLIKIENPNDIIDKLINYYKFNNKTKDELIILEKYQDFLKKEKVITLEKINALFNTNIDENSFLDKEELLKQIDIFINYNEAFDKFTLCNLPLVIDIAKKYHERNSEISLMDLISEGNIGLMKAITMFDITKGFKFSTYATYWIKQTIMRNVYNKEQFIFNVPINTTVDIINFYKKVTDLENKYQRNLSVQEIANILGMNKNTVDLYLSTKKSAVYLDRPIENKDGECGTLADFIPSNESVEDQVFALTLSEDIKILFQGLSEREKQVIALRYGFNKDNQAYTLEQAAKMLTPRITRERVRQIESIALKKMHIAARYNQKCKAIGEYNI